MKSITAPTPTGILRRAHQAFLETYFPFEDPLPDNHKDLALRQGEALWQVIDQNPQIKSLLLFFARLEFFSMPLFSFAYSRFISQTQSFSQQEVKLAVREVRDFLKNTGKKTLLATHLGDLSLTERRAFLNLLSNSPLEWYRRVALSLRILYISKLYEGRLGQELSQPELDSEQGMEAPVSEGSYHFPAFETQLKYSPQKQALEGQVDYLIVGSGVAGSMLAFQLQKAGKSVVVMEKGPMVHPWHYDARYVPRFLREGGMKLNQIGDMMVSAAEIAGGGSTINFDIAFPVSDPWVLGNFAHWREEGLIPPGLWTEESLIRASEEIMELLDVRQVEFDEINANNSVLHRGAREHGLSPCMSWLTTTTDEEQRRNRLVSNKNSAIKQLLWPAMLNENGQIPLTLLVNTEVTRILFDGNKATGVQFRCGKHPYSPDSVWDLYGFNFPEGKTLTLHADKVILAAGTLGSTIILKKSGAKNPNIGKGIVCHPILPIVGFSEQVINNHIGVPSAVYVPDYLTTDHRNPKLDFMIETSSYPVYRFAMSIPGMAAELYENIKNYRHATGAGILFMDEVDPNNRIEVSNKGKTKVFYTMTEADRKRFALAIAETSSILLKGGANKVLLNISQDVLGKGPGSSQVISSESEVGVIRENLVMNPSTAFLYSGHVMCANKVGLNPANSVVDGNFEVWGYKNLHICDASIFPASVSANPMLAIYAVAYLFSEQLLKVENKQKARNARELSPVLENN